MALTVFVCTGPVCGNAGAALARATRHLCQLPPFLGAVTVQKEVCLGYCHQGPNVMVCEQADAWGHAPLAGSPGTQVFHEMNLEKVRAQIEAALNKS